MAIELICQKCSAKLRVPDEHAGKKARCPECGHVTQVPAGAAPRGSARAAPEATAGVGDSGAAASSPSPASADAATAEAAGGLWHMLTPEGYRYGPIGKPELDRWIAEGRVTAECRLRSDGAEEWRPADAVYPALRGGGASAGFQGAAAGQQGGGMIAAPTTQAGQNPFASQQYAVGPNAAAASPYIRPSHYQPHRGVVILILGIIGFVLGGVIGCPILSVIAWMMGSADVAEIRAGRMDPEGMGMTQAGRILGIIYTVMWLASIVLVLAIVGIMLLCGLAGNL